MPLDGGGQGYPKSQVRDLLNWKPWVTSVTLSTHWIVCLRNNRVLTLKCFVWQQKLKSETKKTWSPNRMDQYNVEFPLRCIFLRSMWQYAHRLTRKRYHIAHSTVTWRPVCFYSNFVNQVKCNSELMQILNQKFYNFC